MDTWSPVKCFYNGGGKNEYNANQIPNETEDTKSKNKMKIKRGGL